MTVRQRLLLTLAIPLWLALSGCDQIQQRLGMEDLAAKAARDEEEGKAVGSACRQSGRAIEDCYSIYHWLPKAPIFAGWREMNDYMLENKLEEVRPVLPPPQPPSNGRKKGKAAPAEAAPSAAAVPATPAVPTAPAAATAAAAPPAAQSPAASGR